MATNTQTSDDGRASPASLLAPTTFLGALAVFVVGSLIVKAITGK